MEKLNATIEEDEKYFSEEKQKENRVKTSLRERSMNAENNYPGVDN